MVCRPPEGPALGRAGAEHAEKELGFSACFERFVGKVAVIKSGNCKHSYPEERQRKYHCEGAGAGKIDQ